MEDSLANGISDHTYALVPGWTGHRFPERKAVLEGPPDVTAHDIVYRLRSAPVDPHDAFRNAKLSTS